ncbi:MAG: hypothetical protein R3F59_29825 [Myxococcota bacterium]
MYRCQHCNGVVEPGRKIRRVVVESREKTYFQRKVGKPKRKSDPPPVSVTTTTGWETVRAIRVCRACETSLLEQFRGVPPAERRGVSRA